MAPKNSAQLFSQSLLTGTFAILSLGNAIASEIPTVRDSGIDRQPELLASSTDGKISKIGGIYPINTILDADFSPATSDLALTQTKKRRKTRPQIQNTPNNSQLQIQNNQRNTQPQIPNNQRNTQSQTSNGLSFTQNQIQYKRNDLGVAVQFGNSTSFGIQGKVGVTDNISIRPEFFFGTGGEVENQQTSLLETNPKGEINLITPNSNLYKIKDESILTTSLDLLAGTRIQAGTLFAAGSIFPLDVKTPEGTVLPANVPIPISIVALESGEAPAGIVLAAGTVLPATTEIKAESNDSPILSVVKVESYARDIPLVLTADYKIISSFTPNVAIGDNLANKEIKAGTILPKGTVIPANTPIPVDARTSNNIPVAVPAGLVKGKTTGTSIGLAVTYDFKLDPTGKSTAYLGPKVAISSASGTVNVQGAAAPIALNTNETKIGMVAGLDYAISDGFTIGANATYNFSRNLTGSVSYGGEKLPLQSVGGSSADFGVRLGFQF